VAKEMRCGGVASLRHAAKPDATGTLIMPDRIQPDRAALEVAYLLLPCDAPLDEMLQHPTHKIILENVARRHMQRRAQMDVKKLQANDHD
jgi:hypothetical protein